MYKILRHFSIASLACIVLAAMLLTLFYRHVAIKGIVHLGESINVELAKTALIPVKSRLVDFLGTTADIETQGQAIHPIDPGLEKVIHNIMDNTTVIRIKIYNRHGIVVFSSKQSQIGESQIENSSNDGVENKGFASAINGKVASKLVYRDDFNPFDQVTEEDNLIQTYLPVRRTVTSPIQGVFEIYTDVNSLVSYAEYTQIAIAAGATFILAMLYLTLLIIVRRAEKVMAAQQNTIRERTETLEILSAQLLTAEENEKKHIADQLHENVAQMLSAIKFQVEHACQIAREQTPEENAKLFASVVASIQGAIQKVSAMTMELRPPSLDELGVVATIEWYLREYQALHPEIHVLSEVSVAENRVSRSLKIIIYRIIQETLENIAKFALATQIDVGLNAEDGNIVLTIEDYGRMYKSAGASEEKSEEKRIWFYAIDERAVLSGGTVSSVKRNSGGYTTRITWPG